MSAFHGKSVLITGGASGIGAATARRAAAGGGRVLIADTDEQAGPALAEEIGALFHRTDVGDFDQMKAAVDAAAEAHGGLDVLFCNAGIAGPSEGLIDQGIPYDLDRYRKTVAVNLDGPVHGVHAALPLMRGRQGASILVTSSMAGLFAPPSGEVYAATKHALIGFVRSLALTLADDPLTVNAICPGYVDTPMIAPLLPMIGELGLGGTVVAPEKVAELAERIVAERGSGDAWLIAEGVCAPFPFHDPDELLQRLHGTGTGPA
ncbi:SDR family NAD(P)-dependent oxidoreductase [Nocardiopsis composta]|uniref:NAD(P)-dependent dehydrogenase (Short-subunit alcohol dehydrogenase family) n=1 Tax=Nocardiopsis composta TaxID=157465 RepID=A0A7W8VC37_9ACTN|nr:SDR family NAD(P)-dependent oxidoreductase [Nocardiopsis composta]MBB5430540.1 NAD(P)-dependent dehydrogenase (short-subunit alcohol dehydrogenase family) [Nocardiopsis composta]